VIVGDVIVGDVIVGGRHDALPHRYYTHHHRY
jgi:hypothetical protein